MQASEKGLAGNLISAGDLERILTDYLKTIEVSEARTVARLMINQLRTRNFILCFMGTDYYAFVHRTFLEYFCAWEFVWQFEKQQKISLDELKTEVFGKHWQDIDKSWHEVLRLIVGMINENFAGKIIDYLINEDELDGEIKYFNNILFAVDCLSEVRNKAAITPIANKLLNKLEDLVEERDYDRLLTSGELQVIIDVRTQAIAAIATTWKGNLNTLIWLKTRAQFDNNSAVRLAAVQALARGWKEDPETLAILKTRAQFDNNSGVRLVAMYALARGWKEDPETLAILKTRAQFDEYWVVRCAAVQALATGWKDEPGIFELLCDRAVNDPFERKHDLQDNPRLTALEAIIEHYPDHPQTILLLSDRVNNDSDEQVREFAKKKLALEN